MAKLALKTEEPSEIKQKIAKIEEEEQLEKLKLRKFDENYKTLYTLIQHHKEKFVNCLLEKKEGLLVTLWKGGTKIIRLSNHEVYVYEHTELTEFILKELNTTPEKA